MALTNFLKSKRLFQILDISLHFYRKKGECYTFYILHLIHYLTVKQEEGERCQLEHPDCEEGLECIKSRRGTWGICKQKGKFGIIVE